MEGLRDTRLARFSLTVHCWRGRYGVRMSVRTDLVLVVGAVLLVITRAPHVLPRNQQQAGNTGHVTMTEPLQRLLLIRFLRIVWSVSLTSEEKVVMNSILGCSAFFLLSSSSLRSLDRRRLLNPSRDRVSRIRECPPESMGLEKRSS